MNPIKRSPDGSVQMLIKVNGVEQWRLCDVEPTPMLFNKGMKPFEALTYTPKLRPGEKLIEAVYAEMEIYTS